MEISFRKLADLDDAFEWAGDPFEEIEALRAISNMRLIFDTNPKMLILLKYSDSDYARDEVEIVEEATKAGISEENIVRVNSGEDIFNLPPDAKKIINEFLEMQRERDKE